MRFGIQEFVDHLSRHLKVIVGRPWRSVASGLKVIRSVSSSRSYAAAAMLRESFKVRISKLIRLM